MQKKSYLHMICCVIFSILFLLVKREKQLGIDDDYKSQSPSSVVIVNHLRKVTKSLKQENRNTTNEVFDSSEASTQEKDTTSLETNTSKLKNCISDGDCDDAGGIDSEEEEEEQTMDRDKEYSTKKIKGSNMAAKRSSKRKYERHKAQLKVRPCYLSHLYTRE